MWSVSVDDFVAVKVCKSANVFELFSILVRMQQLYRVSPVDFSFSK